MDDNSNGVDSTVGLAEQDQLKPIRKRAYCESEEPESCQKLDKNDYDASDHPRVLIPELLKQFYYLGWVTGTGGGISIKFGQEIYIAPSGVQKERVHSEDLFVLDVDGNALCTPPSFKNFKQSQCTPLFMCVYRQRNAGSVIHSHSKSSALASILYKGREFEISHLEMIKGVYNEALGRNYRYNEKLVIPIVENTCEECDLESSFTETLNNYPNTCAIIVRRHGFYVWGASWEKAKIYCECLDYLFDMAVQMHLHGVSPVHSGCGSSTRKVD